MSFTRWSKSGLDSLVNGCAARVYFGKVLGYPDPGSPQSALGTAYHAAVEAHERQRLLHLRDGAEMRWLDCHSTGLKALTRELSKLPDVMFERHDLTPGDCAQMLGTAIDAWWEAPIPQGQPGEGQSLRDRVLAWRPVAVEPYFTAPLADVSERPLHGYIDALYYDPEAGQYVTVDHKSTAHFRSWPTSGAGHELEATVYTVGSEVARNLPPRADVRHEWHIARRETGSTSRFEAVRCIALQPGEVEYAHLQGMVQRADAIVEAGAWHKAPHWNLCSPKWCPMHVDAGGPCDPEVSAADDPLLPVVAEPAGVGPTLVDSPASVGN